MSPRFLTRGLVFRRRFDEVFYTGPQDKQFDDMTFEPDDSKATLFLFEGQLIIAVSKLISARSVAPSKPWLRWQGRARQGSHNSHMTQQSLESLDAMSLGALSCNSLGSSVASRPAARGRRSHHRIPSKLVPNFMKVGKMKPVVPYRPDKDKVDEYIVKEILTPRNLEQVEENFQKNFSIRGRDSSLRVAFGMRPEGNNKSEPTTGNFSFCFRNVEDKNDFVIYIKAAAFWA